MASALSYPGVYIEEIPSGVRTITGVATSVTAFIGRPAKGPVNEAYEITTYDDYERVFCGLSRDSTWRGTGSHHVPTLSAAASAVLCAWPPMSAPLGRRHG